MRWASSGRAGLRFGEHEDEAGTGGWFTPARSSSSQDPDARQAEPAGAPWRDEAQPAAPVREPDFGDATWFNPSRPAPERPRPDLEWSRRDRDPENDGFQDSPFQDSIFQDTPFQDSGRRAGAGGKPRGRGITAAHRWAEVTRGGQPAGLNPNRPAPNAGIRETRQQDIPFQGARPIDLSAPPRNAPPRRGPAYGPASASSAAPGAGDGLGGPRPQRPRLKESGALRRFRDTGAMRVIMDTGAMRVIMDTAAMRTLMDTAAMRMLRERYAGRGKMIAAVGLAVWGVLAVVAIALAVTSSGDGPPKAKPVSHASAASGAVAKKAGAAHGHTVATPAPKKTAASRGTAPPSQVLTVIRAEAFGPQGTSDGDNPQRAALVLAGHGTPWQTNWYATAHFASLKPGTGLLLDMGTTMTVTNVTLKLAAGSADVIVRVGNTPVPGTFTTLQERTSAGGTETFQGAKPLHGRYIEVWFSTLPRDAAGTYQESVYGVKVTGQR